MTVTMTEQDRLLRALRTAATDVPDGWVGAGDVRQQLARRGELAPMASTLRVRKRIDELLVDAGLVEAHQTRSGTWFYRETGAAG